MKFLFFWDVENIVVFFFAFVILDFLKVERFFWDVRERTVGL